MNKLLGNIPPTSKPALGPAIFSRSALLSPEMGMAGNAGGTQDGWLFLFVMKVGGDGGSHPAHTGQGQSGRSTLCLVDPNTLLGRRGVIGEG